MRIAFPHRVDADQHHRLNSFETALMTNVETQHGSVFIPGTNTVFSCFDQPTSEPIGEERWLAPPFPLRKIRPTQPLPNIFIILRYSFSVSGGIWGFIF